jgi:molecular chaperone GrpE
MATKRKTDHDSHKQPPAPDSEEAAEPEKPQAETPTGETPTVEAAAPEAGDTEAGDTEAGDTEAGDTEAGDTETSRRQAEPAPDEAAARDGDRRAEELASQLEEANNRYLRLAADFDNFKRRARQEQLDTMRYAAATVVERLLPVLDDANRALAHAPDGVDEGWLKGVRLTVQQLEDVLASVGVERVSAVGSPFDPKLHEAVGAEETAEHPEDTVVVELRPGYRMHDRVLRPALVKVARPPS